MAGSLEGLFSNRLKEMRAQWKNDHSAAEFNTIWMKIFSEEREKRFKREKNKRKTENYTSCTEDEILEKDEREQHETRQQALREAQQALREAERLSALDDKTRLYELGLRVEDAKLLGGDKRQLHYSGKFQAPEGATKSVLVEIGQRWWSDLEPGLMRLVCDPNNKEIRKLIGNVSIPALAAALAVSVVATIGAPSLVIVASSILAMKISESGLKAVCDTWAAHSKGKH
jgi:hypothetical protein